MKSASSISADINVTAYIGRHQPHFQPREAAEYVLAFHKEVSLMVLEDKALLESPFRI